MNAKALGQVGFFMGCIQFGRHVWVNVAEVPGAIRNGIDPPPLCLCGRIAAGVGCFSP
jgi:hypothetical protein